MPTVTSQNKAEFDRNFMEKKGLLKKTKKEKPVSKFRIEPNYDDNEKRNGWTVFEGDFAHDVYPTKKYAQDMIAKWEAHDAKKAMENK